VSVEDSHVEPQGCGGNAAPYVLGALTHEEHESFSRHMESCAVCREEVAALQVVASALPAAAPQLKAPAELRRRVMSSVREDARRQASEQLSESASLPARALSRRAAPARPRWRLGIAGAALAAAAIALALVALAPSGGAGTRVIRAQVFAARASATLSVSDGRAQLSIAGMPQAGPGRVYEVWTKRSASGSPQPTDALFTVTAGGDASVGVPGSATGVREVLVTSEPLGGSRVPTRPAVILARLS